ncbi:MAG: ester cyclase [Acidobacteriota bacterium]|nr:ester cyclase [Acidobacteriota bacterium]
MSREEIVSFFAGRDEAWNRHDFSALTQDHTVDCEVESPVGGSVKGRDAIQNIYKGWFSSFPDVEYRTEHLLIDENRAAQFVLMTGIQRGEFCGLAPTGKRFEIRCAFLFSFKDHKIAHEIRIYDFTGMLLQLGVLKAKPAF